MIDIVDQIYLGVGGTGFRKQWKRHQDWYVHIPWKLNVVYTCLGVLNLILVAGHVLDRAGSLQSGYPLYLKIHILLGVRKYLNIG